MTHAPPDDIEARCRAAIAANPRAVSRYHAGGTALGFLVAQVFRQPGGLRYRVAEVEATLRRLLDAPRGAS